MGSPYTKGLLNAEDFGDTFNLNKIYVARKTTTTAGTAATVTHGLGATPTYVLATCNTKAITYSSGATTITFTKASTGAAVIDVFAAVTS